MKKVKPIKNNRLTRQDATDRAPIIDNPGLPRMDEVKPIDNETEGIFMSTNPAIFKPNDEKNIMEYFSRDIQTKKDVDREIPEQLDQDQNKKIDVHYIRLRLHFDNGSLSIIGAKKVPGPLTMPDEIITGMAYEVFLSSNRIALGSIPDVGVIRSFPNPKNIEGQEGHFIEEVSSYEFNIRIPSDKISSVQNLSKIQISLYEIKKPVHLKEHDKTLLADYDAELREVARLDTIELGKLPKSVQTEINDLL